MRDDVPGHWLRIYTGSARQSVLEKKMAKLAENAHFV